ncbi:MAG: recombinase family protein [Patescibacteria group bacterium]
MNILKETQTKSLPVRTQERPLASSNQRVESPALVPLYQNISPDTIHTKAIKAVIYARVSTQEQAQEKASIPDQLRLCNKVAAEKGWLFVKEYRDAGISGHLTEERHGLQSMLRDGREHKFDLIVVKDYDRFARNKDAAAIIRQELKELGIQTYAINTPVDPKPPGEYDPDEDDLGTIVETISDMRADLERKQIARRMKMGKTAKAKEGIIPNRVPYGYRVIRELEGSKVKRTIVASEEEASRVKFIFNEYARGLGDRKIAMEMNKNGWPSPKGGLWSIAVIRYVLSNPTYTGKVWWGWRHALYRKTKEWRRRGKVGYTGPGNHTPIIDEKLFNLVQETRLGRTKTAKGGTGRSLGLLTGIAKCIRCKSGVGYQKRYHGRSNKNPKWKDTVTYEYICTGYKYKGICSPRVMSAKKLETAVLDHVKNLYAHPNVQERIVYNGKNEEETENEKEIARLEREVAMEESKTQRQYYAYERGIISIEQYQERLEKIREETAKNRMEADRLLSLSSLTAEKSSAIQKLIASFKNFDTIWGAMELDEQKMILRSIIKEIRAGGEKVEIDFIL